MRRPEREGAGESAAGVPAAQGPVESAEGAPRAAPPGEVAGGERRPEPRWHQPELAWPLSLVAGFAGGWVGLQTTIPGLVAIVPGLLFAPLFMPLLECGRRNLAALGAVGWALGVAGAVVGTALESGYADVASAVPGAAAWTREEVRGWVESGRAPAPAGASLLRSAACAVAVVLLARPFLGLVGLPVLAWLVAVVASGAGWFAERAVTGGAADVQAALAGTPPHAALVLAGALLAAVGSAESGRLLPPSRVPRGRRRLLVGGASLVGLGLVAQVLFREAWGHSLAGWLR